MNKFHKHRNSYAQKITLLCFIIWVPLLLSAQCTWTATGAAGNTNFTDGNNWTSSAGCPGHLSSPLMAHSFFSQDIIIPSGVNLVYSGNAIFSNDVNFVINESFEMTGNFQTTGSGTVNIDINKEFEITGDVIFDAASFVTMNLNDNLKVNGDLIYFNMYGGERIINGPDSLLVSGDINVGANSPVASHKFNAPICATNFTATNGATYEINTSLKLSESYSHLVSTAVTITGEVDVKQDFTIDNGGEVITNETVNVGGDLSIDAGELTTKKSISIEGDLSISSGSDVIFEEEVDVISGNILIDDSNVEFLSTLDAGGNFTVNSGTVTIDDATTINGNANFLGGTTTFGGDVNVLSEITVDEGDVEFLSTLTAAEVTVIVGNLLLNDDTYFGAITSEGGEITAGSSFVPGSEVSFGDLVSLGVVIDHTDGTICGFEEEEEVDIIKNPFSLGDCALDPNQILPIELSYFNVSLQNEELSFKWETLSELNNETFEIEYSFDAQNFRRLFSVDGSGTSNSALFYSETHNLLASFYDYSIVYFRLKQIDYSGVYSYSRISSTPLNHVNNQITIYPNPTKDYVTMITNDIEPLSFQVYDILNKNVTLNCHVTSKETGRITINFQELKEGIYIIKTNNSSTKVIKRN